MLHKPEEAAGRIRPFTDLSNRNAIIHASRQKEIRRQAEGSVTKSPSSSNPQQTDSSSYDNDAEQECRQPE